MLWFDFKKHPVYQKKLDQNEMTSNFCFIIDIHFMNSFLILMFFKEGPTKQIGVLNYIISKDIYKWKNYIKANCSNFVIIWRQNA